MSDVKNWLVRILFGKDFDPLPPHECSSRERPPIAPLQLPPRFDPEYHRVANAVTRNALKADRIQNAVDIIAGRPRWWDGKDADDTVNR